MKIDEKEYQIIINALNIYRVMSEFYHCELLKNNNEMFANMVGEIAQLENKIKDEHLRISKENEYANSVSQEEYEKSTQGSCEEEACD